MPEGDTLYKVAAALAPRLNGRSLERVELHGRRRPSLERTVERVRAQGKHLLIELRGEGGEPAEVLRVHLGMWGSWHRYRHQESWRKPRRQASLVLQQGEEVLVCFNAREIECHRSGELEPHPLGRLGPDLVVTAVPMAEIVERARRFAAVDAPVVDLLLDQRIAAGIGNVYKSETLFLEGIDPRVRIGGLDDASLERLFLTARRLLRQNLGPWMRTTTRDRSRAEAGSELPRLWVYGRAGERCLRCRAGIRHLRFGRGHRDTYWCPRCQTAPVEPGRRVLEVVDR